jgi:hypothetical protein
MKMEQTQRFKTSVIKHHTPDSNPKDYTQHSEYGKSLEIKNYFSCACCLVPVGFVFLLDIYALFVDGNFSPISVALSLEV